jgi:lysophospholipase L1-like esterase
VLRPAWALTTLAVIVILQEVLFRSVFPLPEAIGFNRLQYSPLNGSHPDLLSRRGRGLAYDRLRLESEPDGFSYTHQLNGYGFRGADFAIEPSRTRRRILTIGDSVTEGQGSPDASTIAIQLSDLLQRDGTPAEVINLGIIGISLPQLTALVRDTVGLLTPSTVVVILYANDLPAPQYPGALDRPAPAFPRRRHTWWPRGLELIGGVLNGEPIDRRWPHLAIPFFASVPDPSNPWTDAGTPPANVDSALYSAMASGRLNPWLKTQSDALPAMLAHDFSKSGSPIRFLMRMAEVCRANHAQLVLAYVPFSGVVHSRYAAALAKLGMPFQTAMALHQDAAYRSQNRLLAALSADLGIRLADATEDLERAEQEGVAQYWAFDTHPRAAGYTTIARRILHALKGDAR